MKTKVLLLLALILSLKFYAQKNYQKGYFINNYGNKIECLIFDNGWGNNPTEFNYKLNEEAIIKTGNLTSVKEFAIYNSFKYVKHQVNIDATSNKNEDLTKTRGPVFEEKELFLKVLIEGKASLYAYRGMHAIKYFFSLDQSNPEQLIKKSFITESNKISENNEYRQQLWTTLRCPNFSLKKVENLDYREKSLTNYVRDYNNCNNSQSVTFEKKQKKDLFNAAIKLGIYPNTAFLVEGNSTAYRSVNFDKKTAFKIGFEAEFILPFYKNKWALFLEPTYNHYEADKDLEIYQLTYGVQVKYNSIELPIGLRYYFFLNDKSKIFINAAFLNDFNIGDSYINYEYQYIEDYKIKPSHNFAFGIGYKLKDRISMELRFQTKRNTIKYQTGTTSYYHNPVGLVFGYTLF